MATEETKSDEKSAEPLLKQVDDEVDYGYLKLLEGAWVNKDDTLGGLNIISLPAKGTEPDQQAHPPIPVVANKSSFVPVVFRYNERLKFTLKGGARNRGGLSDQLNGAVAYKQTVKGSESKDGPLKVQHVEDGMFLFLNNIRRKPSDADGHLYKPKFKYVRSGTVPHGNSLTILGNEINEIQGPPDFDNDFVKDLLNPVSFSMGPPHGPYAKILTDKLEEMGTNPKKVLKEGIKDKEIILTKTLVLSSKNKGNIVNTPFINEFAQCSEMDVIFWLETVKNTDGTTYTQLQYVQKMILEFQFITLVRIKWPHITVNTMVLEE